MLLIEKMKQLHFSKSEQEVVNFILKDPHTVKEMTIKEIAQKTFSNSTSLVRVANKLGYNKWSEFKTAFLDETNYLNSHYNSIDANLPFIDSDNPLTLATKLAELEQNTIKDTLSILDSNELDKVKKIIGKTTRIKVFASLTNSTICHEFIRSIRRIGLEATLIKEGENTRYEAYLCTSDDCPILVSYTGKNPEIIEVQNILKSQHIPQIVLTSLGDNQLATQSDACLRLSTRERLYTKIGDFSSSVSTTFLLDLIYSLIFQKNYSRNLKFVRETGQLFNKSLPSSDIMSELNQNNS